MSVIQQFFLYNLLPAFGAGLLVWLAVVISLRLFRIEQGTLRLSLLYAPLLKSILVLLGVGVVFSWPYSYWAGIRASAVSLNVVLPILLVWVGLAYLVRQWFLDRIETQVLEQTEEARLVSPRLDQSLDRVLSAYQDRLGELAGEGAICCLNTNTVTPQLYVSDRNLHSPLVITDAKRPIIVFPRRLVGELSDDELDGALAHEYAHYQLSNPIWCSSDGIKKIAPVIPIAGLLSTQLAREEEKACDDMAIRVMGKPDIYAEMLLKSYRFSQDSKNPFGRSFQVLPQLVGLKPLIYDRIERLVDSDHMRSDRRSQFALACLSWVGLYALFGIT